MKKDGQTLEFMRLEKGVRDGGPPLSEIPSQSTLPNSLGRKFLAEAVRDSLLYPFYDPAWRLVRRDERIGTKPTGIIITRHIGDTVGWWTHHLTHFREGWEVPECQVRYANIWVAFKELQDTEKERYIPLKRIGASTSARIGESEAEGPAGLEAAAFEFWETIPKQLRRQQLKADIERRKLAERHRANPQKSARAIRLLYGLT